MEILKRMTHLINQLYTAEHAEMCVQTLVDHMRSWDEIDDVRLINGEQEWNEQSRCFVIDKNGRLLSKDESRYCARIISDPKNALGIIVIANVRQTFAEPVIDQLECIMDSARQALRGMQIQEKRQHHVQKYMEIHDYIVRSVEAGIVAVDENGRILTVNQGALEIFGSGHIQPDELVGTTLFDYLPTDDQVEGEGSYVRFLIETLRTGTSLSQFVRSQNKKTHLVETSILYDSEQTMYGAIMMLHDITVHQARMEHQGQTQKFEVVSQMAAGLAHELGNPLTVVRGFLQLYEKGQVLETSTWQMIIEEVDRVKQLVSEFLLSTRPSAPRLTLVSAKVLFEKGLSDIAERAKQNQIDIAVQVEEGLPLIEADLEQIQRVFENLLNNAIDCLPRGGRIEVSVACKEKEALIIVHNNGPAIPSEIRQKIFDPFFSTKDDAKGLGLAVAYRILESHGGRLLVESSEELGTSFIVTLPLAVL